VEALGLSEHLEHPCGRGVRPERASFGTAGGAICGDLIRIDVLVDGDRVVAAGFEASGCGAAQAGASAAVFLVEGESVFDAARVGSAAIAAELGGLSVGKLHAADLAGDALASALGAAVAGTARQLQAPTDPAHDAAVHDGSAPPEAAAHDGSAHLDAARTLVAMSGGVDSAVAALLVGEDAVGVTLELWRDPDNDASASCCSASAVRAARAVAHGLGMPHFTLDLRDAFRAGVVDPWLAEHAAGLTPNPCVRCNGHVRLDAMVAFADRLGCATLATGHYARTTPDGLLRAGADPAKDQAYMLAATGPATLARLRFPLGELDKPRVRALAAEAGLPVASKAESQDLCFLAGTGQAAFLAKHGALGDRPGDIVDAGGARLGAHAGQHRFTVGQRKGIGVAAGEPLYVLRKDPDANTVTVGTREDLLTVDVDVRDAVLHRPAAEVEAVKLRYHARALPCRATQDGSDVRLELLEPVFGAAPGQAAVLLRGDAVVGVGTIA
jgi:tRNA-specific 2-thiouridylase